MLTEKREEEQDVRILTKIIVEEIREDRSVPDLL